MVESLVLHHSLERTVCPLRSFFYCISEFSVVMNSVIVTVVYSVVIVTAIYSVVNITIIEIVLC